MNMNPVQTNKNLMLIIDDDFINREVLKNIFSSMFRFVEAENGLEGLEKVLLHAHELCAILLDVEMPKMDGLSLLKHLHARDIPSQIPVFLITSVDELEVARGAYEMGVMGVISKPVVPFITLRRVETVVELYQAREALRSRVEQQEQKLQENVETIDTLHRNTLEALAAAIEFRDVESGEHTNRIYGITKILLRDTPMGAGFTPEEIENMAIGSIMHDVGKIAISDVILNKPGRLTRGEFETMKTHTTKGADLMKQLSRVQTHPSYQYAMDIARHHHERWDGRGYPDGLKGEEISVWSQVVSIADVYDALVSPRVYKKAFTPDQAVAMIKNGECGAFNPQLLRCFLEAEPQLRRLYQFNEAEAAIQPDDSQELIDVLLMSIAVQAAYDMIISANLTENTYHIIGYDNFQTHCSPVEGTFDDLIRGGVESVPEEWKEAFYNSFAREKLLEAYRQGRRSVTLNHPQYTDAGELKQVSTSVYFMEDPRNGNIREMTLVRYRQE